MRWSCIVLRAPARSRRLSRRRTGPLGMSRAGVRRQNHLVSWNQRFGCFQGSHVTRRYESWTKGSVTLLRQATKLLILHIDEVLTTDNPRHARDLLSGNKARPKRKNDAYYRTASASSNGEPHSGHWPVIKRLGALLDRHHKNGSGK
jgi:hypothetical protein